jgi:hypothetical protein
VAFFTNIIHRFGVPNSIITDNGTQFTGRKFLDFCEDHHIQVDWAAMAHPMTNGQVERANDMILQGLKPRIYNDLNKFGKRWTKELPSVVWSLRTTPSRATGFTPFFLVYGAEAILPTLGAVPAVLATLPRPRGPVPRPPGGRPGASATTGRPRAAQVRAPRGGGE